MAKILVVEDELVLQNAIMEGLKSLGFEVDGAGDGHEALDKFFVEEYDLIILDLNLPNMDGLEVLKIFREDRIDCRIIILSARSEVEEKVAGLNLGANDYLAKPFDFKELVARVNGLLLREFVQYQSVIKCNDYELDLVTRRLVYHKEQINLSKTEFDILEFLFRRQKTIITSEQFIDILWPDDDGAKNKLKVHISNIRNKMPVNIIHSKWGVGYYVE